METKLITSMYSHAVGALVLAFVGALVLALSIPSAMAKPQTEFSGWAVAEWSYDAAEKNWEWRHNHTCEALIEAENQRLAYRSRYYWAEFNGNSLGPYTGEDICRKCLQVKRQTIDDWVTTVRIIEVAPNTDNNVEDNNNNEMEDDDDDDEMEDDDDEMEDDDDEVEDNGSEMEDDDTEAEDSDDTEAEDNDDKEVVLRIDINAFNEIDPYEERNRDGEQELMVDYRIVDCEDN